MPTCPIRITLTTSNNISTSPQIMINEVSGLCLEDDRSVDRLYRLDIPLVRKSNNRPAPWLCQPSHLPTSQRALAPAHSYNLVSKTLLQLGEEDTGSTGVPAWRPQLYPPSTSDVIQHRKKYMSGMGRRIFCSRCTAPYSLESMYRDGKTPR